MSLRVAGLLLSLSAAPVIAAAQSIQVVHDFAGPTPTQPRGLIQTADGSFYGTNEFGAHGGGIFRLSPDGALTIVHRFDTSSVFVGDLGPGEGGIAYGTTRYGGAAGRGTVFAFDPGTASVRVLYAFTGADAGVEPVGGVTQAGDGLLYGVTRAGGVFDGGTVYRVDPVTGAASTLHHFQVGSAEGDTPSGRLTLGADGSLYGTTTSSPRGGELFRLNPETGVLTILPGFGVVHAPLQATLTRTRDGALYGVTRFGGAGGVGSLGAGTVFRVDERGLAEAVYWFDPANGVDGQGPSALVEGADGHLYGTTSSGPGGQGTIFRVRRFGGTAQHAVDTIASLDPITIGVGSLNLAARDGFIYGLADGPSTRDTVFRFDPLAGGSAGNPWQLGVFHTFDGPGEAPNHPAAALTPSGEWLYGMTNAGGAAGRGVVYSVSPATGAVRVLGDVPGTMAPLGHNSTLVRGPDGRLYGTSATETTTDIIRVDPAAGHVTAVFSIAGIVGGLVGSGNHLYGLRWRFEGVDIVRIDVEVGVSTTLLTVPVPSNDLRRHSELVAGGDGRLYFWVAWVEGRRTPRSRFYRLDPERVVVDEPLAASFAYEPQYGSLVAGPGALLYVGVVPPASAPPASPVGLLEYDTSNGRLRPACRESARALTLGPDGDLYGFTSDPVPAWWHCDPATGATVERPLDVMTAADTALTLGGDGLFYGVSSGGPFGGGFLFRIAPTGTPPLLDTDGDGLDNAWEGRYRLSTAAVTGDDGAGGDPDHDGRTNAEEYADGSHPRGMLARVFAEGATGAFYSTRLALANPTVEPATVLLRFFTADADVVSRGMVLPPLTQRTIEVGSLPGLASANVSTFMEADRGIVVDRTMRWDASGYGSHTDAGVTSAATSWLLAEGSTAGDFALFYLLLNPQRVAVTATVRYLRPLGQAPVERTYVLPAESRTTIAVDGEGPELASTDLSAAITATAPIVAERAMYRSLPGQPFAAGHATAGVTAPALEWFLAEGATGPFFDLFVLIANPNPTPADVAIDYLLVGGGRLTGRHSVPAMGRLTIPVDDEEIPAGSGQKPLVNAAVSTIVRSTNAVPLVVERTMWWPGPLLTHAFWYESHHSAGATAAATRWAFADGEVGGADGAETYVLIANPTPAASRVAVTALFEDGSTATRNYDLPAASRTNVRMSVDLPATVTHGRFGAVVESLGLAPVPIVVERSTYASPGGVTWSIGASTLATRIP